MKKRYFILGMLAFMFTVAQFIPHDLPAVETNNPADIMGSGLVGKEVSIILKKSCYSCHSNETEYPWYSFVAPPSWIVAQDIRDAREELNFSIWMDYDMMEKLEKLDDISIEVGESEMPLAIYTLMHPPAKLDDKQRETIVAWAEASMDVVAEEKDEEEE